MEHNLKNRFTVKEKIGFALKRSKGIALETGLKPYLKILDQIKKTDLTKKTDEALKETARRLRLEAAGNPLGPAPLVPVFALVREACLRTLAVTPYDEQILAGIVLSRGKLAEMQ